LHNLVPRVFSLPGKRPWKRGWSLQAYFDALVNMLSELYFPISVLGVTETKLKNDQDALVNVNLTGYDFFSQPSGTNGGYIKAETDTT